MRGAGTTRPAIYRRWKDKPALVVDAIARLAEDAGLRDIAFDTVFRMQRPANAGQTEFPVFLMIATKA